MGMMLRPGLLAVGLLALLPGRAAAADMGAGHVTGLGGVFVKSKDPKALAAWYRDVLGMRVESWGGAVLRYDAPLHPPAAAWTALKSDSTYTAPSSREFMLDFAVDDLDAIIARLAAHGVAVLKRDDSDPSGKFAWVLDPDGTKIELWQPKRP
jgi:catechol 2,3-dioxygenase-like lactoylglutathione lyase family enzyme